VRETGRNGFKTQVMEDLRRIYPDAIILLADANHLQGIPDILILHENQWAALECKASARAVRQPNQEYYVGKMNSMSFAAFIYPENKDEVLDDLQLTLRARRPTRFPWP
jgi:hypothetical protein